MRLALIFFLFSAPAFADTTLLWHFGISALGTTGGAGIAETLGVSRDAAPWVSLVGVLALGLAKEVFIDSRFSKGDAAADLAGAVTGFYLYRALTIPVNWEGQ
jgi:uncharacterized protein YfiM (DUF2279 family)